LCFSTSFFRPTLRGLPRTGVFPFYRLRRYPVPVLHLYGGPHPVVSGQADPKASSPYLRVDKTIIWWIRKSVCWSEPHNVWDKLFSRLSSFQFSLSSNVIPNIRCFLTFSIFSVSMSILSLNLVFPLVRDLLLWISLVFF
jgi:hypothetical protein